jgi:hypothetical protein
MAITFMMLVKGFVSILRAGNIRKGFDSARLHCAMHCHSLILVEKKPADTCFHIRTLAVSTWSHVSRVEENNYPTPKQAPKNVAATKSSHLLKQSCGKFKTATPT